MRELVTMLTALRREQADHTAAICATILNSRMGIKQSQCIDPEKLNPYRKRKKKKGERLTIEQFGRAFEN